MKDKFILAIVFSSALGLDAILIQYMFFEESSYPFLNGLQTFKYFTLQSNLIVFLYFLILYSRIFEHNKLFNKLFGGVVVYITITFIVYSIFIEPFVSPQGFAFIGSLLNHYVTPILVIAFISKYKGDYTFSYKDIKIWIIYPLVYLIFLVILGSISNNYLYPFFQVEDVGYIGLLIAIISVNILFYILSFILVKLVSNKESVSF